MSARVIILLLFAVLATACAAVEPARDEINVQGGFISGSGSWFAERPIFDKPVTLTPVVGGGHSALGGDCDALSRTLSLEDEFLPDLLGEHQIPLGQSGPLLLRVEINSFDMPTNLNGGELANYCFMILRVKLEAVGMQSVSWKPDDRFPGMVTLMEDIQFYRVQPDRIIPEVKERLYQVIYQIGPTVKGEVEDSCGYFKSHLIDYCKIEYHDLTHELDEALGCTKDEEEAQAVRRLFTEREPEFMSRLSRWREADFPEPGEGNADAERCDSLRAWLLKEVEKES